MIEPVRIEPEALYDDGALRQALGLTAEGAGRRQASRIATLHAPGEANPLQRGLDSGSGLMPPQSPAAAAGREVDR